MKVQIRHSVFETNSSSVHTLTICTKPIDEDILKMYAGTTLTFGSPWRERETGNHFQDRLDNLFDYMTVNDCLSSFIRAKYRIEKVLSKYDITCKFLISETGDYDNYYSCGTDVFDDLFNENDEEFEKLLLCYIFNDKSKAEIFNRDYFHQHEDLLDKVHTKNYIEYD